MIVYVLVNSVNSKCYVGQTSRNSLTKRWGRNLTNSKNPHFARAVEKYGPEAFQRRILAYASCREELDLLEQFHILTLQSSNPKFGYNIQLGGWKAKHTAESKRKLSEARKLYWQTRTPKEKQRFAKKMKLVWKHRTETERAEICARISEAMIRVRQTIPPWTKGRVGPNAGRPSPMKGKKLGPPKHPYKGPPLVRSEAFKQRVSEGLRRYWACRRRGGRYACCV